MSTAPTASPPPHAPPQEHRLVVPEPLAALAADVADQLTDPTGRPAAGTTNSTDASSLADGAAGIALLHLARAHSGHGDPATARAWLAHAAAGGVTADEQSSLFHGAPALAFALHTAALTTPGAYARALDSLDTVVLDLTRRRLDAAHHRIDSRQRPGFAEYDVLRGLTGLGAHHLRRHPHHPVTADVLNYLVRLTYPLTPDDDLPGWWTHHGPDRRHPEHHPDGHANLGMAHGITGPLALLALAARRGVLVDGHLDAIHRICTWFDTWRQDGGTGPYWPEILTLSEHRTGRLHHPGPHRPSWCYGTPGIARAQQLAAIATHDTPRRYFAETALLNCLRDSAQTSRITGPGLCHGLGGFLHTLRRAADDATTHHLADALAAYLARQTPQDRTTGIPSGLLDGITGLALALHTVTDSRSNTGWDRFLLIA
ncbi:lanthionine synthetase C family protein [Saccharothrix sp. Mg75]|uniref:lanthionine synthetase C family protein n=1 Tax=Saccharothrix sp. Mg75 TaxID=3445357 RepID=UPI003EE8EBAA